MLVHMNKHEAKCT